VQTTIPPVAAPVGFYKFDHSLGGLKADARRRGRFARKQTNGVLSGGSGEVR
jgi:hypothetical protein